MGFQYIRDQFTDFNDSLIYFTQLKDLVDSSTIGPTLNFIGQNHNSTDIIFDFSAALTPAEETELSNVCLSYFREKYDNIYAIIREEQPVGTNGGVLTANTWNIRTINTILGNQNFAVLNEDNTFTLKQGTYKVNIRVPGYKIGTHKSRLYNITNILVESIGNTNMGVDSQTYSEINDILQVFSVTTFRVEQICSKSGANTDGGLGSGFNSESEIFTEIVIQKH
jgi:hypothetical protein